MGQTVCKQHGTSTAGSQVRQTSVGQGLDLVHSAMTNGTRQPLKVLPSFIFYYFILLKQ